MGEYEYTSRLISDYESDGRGSLDGGIETISRGGEK